MASMKQVVVALAAAAILAAPAAAQRGQDRPAREGRGAWTAPGSMARNPVATLLAQREALELTADQVRQLESIAARVEAENAPRVEQLRAVLGDRSVQDLTADERAELRERLRELEPVRAAIRETNRTAMAEARDILTADQALKLRDVMRRGAGEGFRGRGPAGMRGGLGAPGADGALPVPLLLAEREALGLTAEQVARLEAIRDSHRESREAARESRRQSLEAVREILTDEQEAKLRELVTERRATRGDRPARGARPGGRF